MPLLYNITKNIGGFIVTTYNSEMGGSITNSEKARKSWIEWNFTEEEVPQLQFIISYPDGLEPTVYLIPLTDLCIDSVRYDTQDLVSEILTSFLDSSLVQLGDLENVRIIGTPANGTYLLWDETNQYWKNEKSS